MAKQIRVFYDGPLDADLDNEIESSLREIGYQRWASGFDFTNNQRDLAFDYIATK